MREILIAATVLLTTTTSVAVATHFDGSKPLLCAATEATECVDGAGCVVGSAEAINLPEFFRIDFKEKEIRSTRADGTKRSTPLENLSTSESGIILRGAQQNLGWTMSISSEGRMSLAVSGDRVAYTVFGICTVP